MVICKSICGVAVVVSVAELLAVLVSVSVDVTEAVLEIVPVAVPETAAVTVIVALAPGANEPKAALKFCPLIVPVPCETVWLV